MNVMVVRLLLFFTAAFSIDCRVCKIVELFGFCLNLCALQANASAYSLYSSLDAPILKKIQFTETVSFYYGQSRWPLALANQVFITRCGI